MPANWYKYGVGQPHVTFTKLFAYDTVVDKTPCVYGVASTRIHAPGGRSVTTATDWAKGMVTAFHAGFTTKAFVKGLY